MKKLEIYKCPTCGNIVELEHVGGGGLSCCGKPMQLQIAGSSDGAGEKHIPVIDKTDNGYIVKVSSVEHPMLQEHYIEWIEIITENNVYRTFLKPEEKPEAFFPNINEKIILVREYCNIHGLWETVIK